MKNLETSRILREIAKILQIKGENVFRIRAYERAAQNIEGLSENIENFVKEGRLREIPGVGKDISERILEFLGTGNIRMLEDLKKTIPPGLLDLLKIPSVGPKKAKLLYDKLQIKNIPDLEKAIQKNKLQGLFGIKEKTVENILKGIQIFKKGRERLTLGEATYLAQDFLEILTKIPEVKAISTAGSLRRQKETVGDIDILVVSGKPKKVMGVFTKAAPVKDIMAQGETKASVRTKDDIQIDCRVVKEESFGAALLYFTGSKNFNIKLRKLAIEKGLKLNEYGVFKGNRSLAGKTEKEIFKLLGISYIEPEMREDNGEIELAKDHNLPQLINIKDIKGEPHAHSDWSDGLNTIEEMAQAGRDLGYSYIAITDHSQSLKVAGGLSLPDLHKKRSQIDRVNKKINGIKVLYGAEVDIDSEGALDYKDAVLKEFDIVIAAIHTGFKQSRSSLTRRIVLACQNKYVHIIAHPTGRLWGVRDAYDIDFDEILRAAKDTNTHLEINAFSQRLDLNDLGCRRAKEAGVKLSIGTDAHQREQLKAIGLGVAVARRGWLTKKDVINTLPLEELLKEIKK